MKDKLLYRMEKKVNHREKRTRFFLTTSKRAVEPRIIFFQRGITANFM